MRFLWYTPWYSSPAGGGLRSRSLRSGEGAEALSASGGQRRERGVRSGHGPDAAERVRRQLRSGHRRSLQRHGQQQRSELPEGLPRQPGHRARAASSVSRGTSPATRRPPSTRAPGCITTRTSTRTAWTRWRGILRRRTRRASSTGRWTRCWPPERGRVLESSEQRVRHRARREDAAELQLLGRHPARARVGHGDRRDLCRLPDEARRDVDQHQRRPGRSPVPRHSSGEPESADGELARSRTSSCGRTRATRTSRSDRTSATPTTTRCRCS